MVRINLVKPEHLTDQHLLAEYVEIKMQVKFMLKYPNGNIPKYYTLDKGHMSFFRDKPMFLAYRFLKICEELSIRKFNLSKLNYIWMMSKFGYLINKSRCNYTPTEHDIAINKERIIDRLLYPLKMKKPHTYYGKEINTDEFVKEHYKMEIRRCSECGEPMCEGFYIMGCPKDEYYCSNNCLHKHYTGEEWNKMYNEAHDEDDYSGDSCYWTQWESYAE